MALRGGVGHYTEDTPWNTPGWRPADGSTWPRPVRARAHEPLDDGKDWGRAPFSGDSRAQTVHGFLVASEQRYRGGMRLE
jgi:hypothetical protein